MTSFLLPKAERKPSIIGSPQQTEIWSTLAKSQTNLVVNALAGTGKTTTIIEGAKRLTLVPSRLNKVGFVAFNVAIKNELKRRLPPGVSAMTLHGLGLSLLSASIPEFEVDADHNKINAILDEVGNAYGYESYWPKGLRYMTSQLTSLAKSYGITIPDAVPSFYSDETRSDLHTQLEDIAIHHGLDVKVETNQWYDMVLEALYLSFRKTSQVDFDDMVWLPLQLGVKPATSFATLMVDEAQDLNIGQRQLVLLTSDRQAVIGDTNQSIYGFRGADSESIRNILEALRTSSRGVTVQPLTVTRRCPQLVTELARRIVPEFECLPDAVPGCITESEFDPINMAQPKDMILCRTNAPLVEAVYRFWSERRPAYIQGRDMAKPIKSLLSLLEPTTPEDLITKLRRFEDREATRIMSRKSLNDYAKERHVSAMRDRVECLARIASSADSISDINSHLDQIFVDKGEGIRLSTIHKAKGLEADRVMVLRPDLLPLPYAQQPWELRQEMNLAYVAVTRTRNQLDFLGGMPPALLSPVPAPPLTDDQEESNGEPNPTDPSPDLSTPEVHRGSPTRVEVVEDAPRRRSKRNPTSKRTRN